MSSPDLTPAEAEAVQRVLQTPHLSMGGCIAEFEKRFAAYCGAPFAIGVSSGTAGLHLCVIAAGVGEGDLVITTPFSFVASANAILYERAVPIFVDVDPATGNIDPSRVAEAAEALCRGTSDLRTRGWLPPSLQASGTTGRLKALLPVHAFGQPADMAPLVAIAQQHNLSLIEDACESVGATYNEHRTGSPFPGVCWTGCFAFYPNKQMTTGEGGMLVTDNQEWDGLFRSLRNQGCDVFDAWLTHSRLGYNYRLDEMSAALGLAQLERIEELLAKRDQLARWYSQRLEGVEGIQLPQLAPTTSRMSWFVYVIRLESGINRKGVMATLEEQGIPSRPYFTPIHLQPVYVERYGFQRGSFPITEAWGDTCLALPFSGVMSEDQVEYICRALLSAVRHG